MPRKVDVSMQLQATQQVPLSVTGTDAEGNPVSDLGDVTWESSDSSIIAVDADADDPTKAVASATGPVGTAAVTVTADPDRDTGTPNFQGSLAIDVVAGEVTEVVITAGTPTEKP
jgi:hypothetical protein